MKRTRDSEWWDRGMRAAAAKVVNIARKLRKEQQRCAETPDREEDEAGCGCDALADDLDEAIEAFDAAVKP